jgi:ATP-dependent RNA helicase DHX29
VAERVADERCEPSPGSDGSLIGYQVRLDSARCSFVHSTFCFKLMDLINKLLIDLNWPSMKP